jgi:hypothetical protein
VYERWNESSEGPVREGEADLEPAIYVFFAPRLRHPDLPVEIINRRDLMNRMPTRHFLNLQRARFHQLAICVGSRGTHHVDSVPFDLSPGIVLHIRAGQVQKFESPDSDALMVIWPVEHDPHNGATHCRQYGRSTWLLLAAHVCRYGRIGEAASSMPDAVSV